MKSIKMCGNHARRFPYIFFSAHLFSGSYLQLSREMTVFHTASAKCLNLQKFDKIESQGLRQKVTNGKTAD